MLFYVTVWRACVCWMGTKRTYFIVVQFDKGELVILSRGKIVIKRISKR